MSGPKLVALSLGGTALTAATAVLTASNHTPDTAALAATGRALMVGVPFAVGLYAWQRGLGARFGPLLVLMAVVASLTTLAESGNDVAYSSGRVAGWVFEVGLVYLMLSFPSGLSSGVDRWLVGVTAGVAALLFLPSAALVEFYPEPSPYGSCDGDCPPNAFFLLGTEPAVVDSLMRPLREILTALVFVAVALRLAQRIRRASPPMRRTLAPLLLVAAIRCATFAMAFPIRAASPGSPLLDVLFWIFALALPLMAVAFLAGELHSRLFVATALERLGTMIGATPSSGTLRSALAKTLDDESLEVATWAPGTGGWVDADGSPVQLPGPDSGRSATEIRYDRRRVAVLIHDEALDEDPGFVEAVGVYALVAFENRRLMARVQASTREVHDSRSRILASANEERRRIERDLHDGAQQQLVALRIHLELMEETLESDPARAREKLHALGDEVEVTLDSIRSLARGVYPALLEDRGLVEALRSVMRGMPIQASVNPDGSGRYTPEVETAVYFCCLEAIQNASKHATGARHITISLTQGEELGFEVRDDGGGFDTTTSSPGAGLVNMRDRVAALGGELTVTSAPGEGTTVTGSLPVQALGGN